MFPKGVLIDCCCVLLGANFGSIIRKHVPARIKEPMNTVFGIAAMAIGIISVIKLNSLPAVILALILGTLIGEIFNFDNKVRNLFYSAIHKMKFKIHGDREEYMKFYLIVAVTLCASGTNVFGAISEGMTGDFTILLSKGVMDIFAATIFGATLGKAMNLIVVPQFIILCACFYSAELISLVTTQSMLNDFIAVGGLLTFVLGISIAGIKHIKAVNMLPSLFLIWPASWLFDMLLK